MERIGLFIKAIAFAAAKHSTQRRKDEAQSAYVNHPIALATALSMEGGITCLDKHTLCTSTGCQDIGYYTESDGCINYSDGSGNPVKTCGSYTITGR